MVGALSTKKKNELMDLLVEIQEPHKLAYKEKDQEEKDRKAKFEADIQAKIDKLYHYRTLPTGANSDVIADLIQECGETDTEEGFYHRATDAFNTRNESLESLNNSLMDVVAYEAEQVRQAELAEQNRIQQEAIEVQQEQMRLQQAEMDAKQAIIDKAENEANEKAQAEAAEKQRIINEKELAEIEKQRAIEREEYAKKQSEQAVELARNELIHRQQEEQEAQRLADEKRAKNTRHATKIKTQAKKFIMSFDIDEKTAVKLVQAISHKEESTLTINY